MKFEKVIELYPRLYHMAERGTWNSIKNRGLLSTTAVLDHFNVAGVDRRRYESAQRPEKMEVLPEHHSSIVLRDQKPMPKDRLIRALAPSLTPEDWYRIINSKVFFWVSEERLHRLLKARHYRYLEHDVLTIDTASFVNSYQKKISLCHMNSGNTFPMPHIRDFDTFCRIEDYPVNTRGNPVKEVVELVVDYSVPDISRYVIEVNRMIGEEIIDQIWRRVN